MAKRFKRVTVTFDLNVAYMRGVNDATLIDMAECAIEGFGGFPATPENVNVTITKMVEYADAADMLHK